MQENEQKQFDKDAQKKALIGNGIILFVVAVGIILAVFAWFSVLEDKATARGISVIANDNLDIRFNTYAGTMQSNGTIVYDETPLKNLNNPAYDEDDASNLMSLFPGERRYFKTVISNYETSAYTGSFTLQSILVNKKLVTTRDKVCVIFGSNLEGGTYQQSFDLATAQNYYENGVESDVFSIVGTQTVYENLALEAGQQSGGNVSPRSVTVYWYVLLNGDAVDNSAMGEQMLKFQKIKFIIVN